MPNLSNLIERTLPEEISLILLLAADAASAHEDLCQELYLVGGPVRDILRGVAPSDLDLSVVGDAQAFADVLAMLLGGKVLAKSEFGTAKMSASGYTVDLATARQETYERPGALPAVTPDGIEADLARRDFTVNAMAIQIGPSPRLKWGELVDPHGGMSDLGRRRVRVLHDGSFRDDATRILRALRYEARLEYKIAGPTQELITRDRDYLSDITPARVRNEFTRILEEPTRADILGRAEELGVMAAISPALRIPDRVRTAMAEAPGRPMEFHIALIGAALAADEADRLINRLHPPGEWASLLRAGAQFWDIARLLEDESLKPSEAADLLSGFPELALEAQLALAPPTGQRRWLERWLKDLRHRRPELDGDDLLTEGVPRGPAIGRLLDELRRAKLDGVVHDRGEELALVRRRLPVLLSQRDHAGK
ncbi:MAG: CCA tRNA nucleotidyltransferase [Chloroflexota bacterium]